MELLDRLELEHLEGEQHQLAEAIGIESYRQLIRQYAGTAVYIPAREPQSTIRAIPLSFIK